MRQVSSLDVYRDRHRVWKYSFQTEEMRRDGFGPGGNSGTWRWVVVIDVLVAFAYVTIVEKKETPIQSAIFARSVFCYELRINK